MRPFLSFLLVCLAGKQAVAQIAFGFTCYAESSIRDKIASADAVVVGEWISSERLQKGQANDLARPTFQIVETLKDPQKSLKGNEVVVKADHTGKPGELALLLGSRVPDLAWDKPIAVTETSVKYIKALPAKNATEAERLEFFLDYLEHPEDLLAKDAYFEMETTSFEEIQKISEKLPRDKLRQWVADKGTRTDRLGLYGQMLGVCGNNQDAKLLEDIINQPFKGDFRVGIDGLMGGYLLLKGEEGLKLLEETKLKPGVKTTFHESYSAMQAVIFAWDYGDNIEKDRLKQSMQILLDRPDFADLAVNQLARWKDWEIQDKVMGLYDTKAFETPSYRRAIVNYLLACSKDSADNADGNPVEEHAMTAKKHLGTLREKDPETVKQAERYFEFSNP